jgi:thymidylate kinase
MAEAGQLGEILPVRVRRPCLVSFSGIDGSGKTTQIEAVLSHLREAGLRVRLLRFWDDIAVFGRLREVASHNLFKSEKGIGTPGKPVQRRDKNVRSWYMTVVRILLYGLDAIRLAYVVAATSSRRQEFVVFDRYLYDELANLNLENSAMRVYARMLLKMAPIPDVAFLLDADPSEAQARKPEYPLEFMQSNRAAYLTLTQLAGHLTVVEQFATEVVTEIVLRRISAAFPQLARDFVRPAVYSPKSLTNKSA